VWAGISSGGLYIYKNSQWQAKNAGLPGYSTGFTVGPNTVAFSADKAFVGYDSFNYLATNGIYAATLSAGNEPWIYTGPAMAGGIPIMTLAAAKNAILAAGLHHQNIAGLEVPNKIYRSTTSGLTWNVVRDTTSTFQLNAYGDTVLAATSWGGLYPGLYMSTDGGVHWERDDFPETVVLSTVRSGRYLYVGTWDGVFRSLEPFFMEDTTRTDTVVAPPQFKLGQNYPNPFSSSTTITVSAPGIIFPKQQAAGTAGPVRISVYNTLGQLVDEVFEGPLPPGTSEIRYQPHRLASGVYFYRLRAGEFVQTRKLLLLR
ncbi:MAG: T9SS type A sorting domain-containing protein, partial [Ignavibacteriae bacterium]|nr:T9SS type A sorting domain-containing protein [Ignavibacteriota bacterium]